MLPFFHSATPSGKPVISYLLHRSARSVLAVSGIMIALVSCSSEQKRTMENSCHLTMDTEIPTECKPNANQIQIYTFIDNAEKDVPMAIRWEKNCTAARSQNEQYYLEKYRKKMAPQSVQTEYREDGGCGILALYPLSEDKIK